MAYELPEAVVLAASTGRWEMLRDGRGVPLESFDDVSIVLAESVQPGPVVTAGELLTVHRYVLESAHRDRCGRMQVAAFAIGLAIGLAVAAVFLLAR